MLRFLCCFLCIGVLYARDVPTDLSKISKPQTLRILLTSGCPEAFLEIHGRYQICDPDTQMEIVSSRFSSSHPLTATEEGIRWGRRLPSFFHMRFVPIDRDTTILLNGVVHKGCLEVHQEGNLLRIVSEIDIETYLRCALPLQCKSVQHPAALEAVAIVARTRAYALAQKGCTFDATALSYTGWGHAVCPSLLDRAIESTRGMVLLYQRAPFEALFTQDSAGRTASMAHIFRKNIPCPSGVSIPALAKQRESHSWSFSITRKELAQLAHLPALSAVYAFQDKFSGKVYALRLKGGNSFEDIDFLSLQKLLGPLRLKSNDFSIVSKGDIVIFTGYGEGHGVGLCLYGAERLAQQGYSTISILKTFFPDTEIR